MYYLNPVGIVKPSHKYQDLPVVGAAVGIFIVVKAFIFAFI